jgi:hypothetical protein
MILPPIPQLFEALSVFTRPIAGEEKFTETVFKPESFSTLNKEAKFPQTIIP